MLPPISQTLGNEVMSPTWAASASASAALVIKLSSLARCGWLEVPDCVGSTALRCLILYHDWTRQHKQPPKGGGWGRGVGGGGGGLPVSPV